MRLVERRMKSQGAAMPPEAQLQKQLLERMIVDRAQLQLAKETGIRIDDSLLDRAIARMAEQNKMSLQEFRNQLEREGMSFSRFREEIRDEITITRSRLPSRKSTITWAPKPVFSKDSRNTIWRRF
jgi:peptidyl-prolyl cis-trans isomerase SurA